jgi:exodeoxyribonuclease VII small subunit
MSEKKTFDETLQKLEETVRKLEKGDLPLDQALSAYEEGVALSTDAHAHLVAADERIKKLVRNATGVGEESLTEPQDDNE